MSAYSIATRGLAGRKVPQGTLTAMGELLFSASEPGAWYDPSDMSTLFQDSAGTTPVTAVEQPVGRILDKSGRGNHATQATTTKRPVLSRRVNLFEETEGQIVSNTNTYTCERVAGNSPPGTEGYIKLTATGVAAVPSKHFLAPSTSVAVSFYLKKGSSSTQTVMLRNATTATNFLPASIINMDTGAVTGPWSCSDAGNGWWKLSLVHTTGISPGNTLSVYLGATAPSEAGAYWLLAGITATPPIDAHLPYQRVNTATDYDADPAKFPAYLRFDGVDDALQTGNIDFTGTDKMTVWAGVRKNSDAATMMLAELSTNSDSTNGTFALAASVFGNNYYTQSRGTVRSVQYATGYVAPNSAVLVAEAKISTDTLRLHVNNAAPLSSATDQGTGNYGNYPLYIGSRGGVAYPFNGRLYQLIIRGAQSSLSQIEATEAYIKQKMRLP